MSEAKNRVDVHVTEDFNINVNYIGLPEDVPHVDVVPIDMTPEVTVQEDLDYEMKGHYMTPDDLMFEAYQMVRLADAPEQRVDHFFRSYLDRMLTMAIVAASGEGKTSILCHILNEHRGDKPMVLFRHPDKETMKGVITDNGRVLHFIDDFDRIIKLNNAIVVIDEPQLLFPGRKGFDNLLKFMSIARHKGVGLIFISNESRWFQARIEAYIQVWIVKDQDPDLIKRGSKVIKIIKRAFPPCRVRKKGVKCDDNPKCEGQMEKCYDHFRLNVDEFLFSSRKFDHFNSKEGETYRFDMVSWFTDEMSRAYRNASIPQAKTEPVLVQIQN